MSPQTTVPSSSNETENGRTWKVTGPGAFRPRIKGGKAVLSGTQPEAKSVWLTRGDRDLNGKFIYVESTVEVRTSDRNTFRFLAYTKKGRDGNLGNAVGFEKTARGEFFVTHRRQSDSEFTREALKDEAGNAVAWPDGPVTLRIARVDVDGNFVMSLNGIRVGKAALKWKRRAGQLYFGFNWSATRGEEHKTSIDGVRVRRYK